MVFTLNVFHACISKMIFTKTPNPILSCNYCISIIISYNSLAQVFENRPREMCFMIFLLLAKKTHVVVILEIYYGRRRARMLKLELQGPIGFLSSIIFIFIVLWSDAIYFSPCSTTRKGPFIVRGRGRSRRKAGGSRDFFFFGKLHIHPPNCNRFTFQASNIL